MRDLFEKDFLERSPEIVVENSVYDLKWIPLIFQIKNNNTYRVKCRVTVAQPKSNRKSPRPNTARTIMK